MKFLHDIDDMRARKPPCAMCVYNIVMAMYGPIWVRILHIDTHTRAW